MESIKTFFLLLFFSKWILLTPSPITLSNEWHEITPKNPLEAITGGAAIYVDVSHLVENVKDISELNNIFPKKIIQGKLVSKYGEEVHLINNGTSYSNDAVYVIVSSLNNVPTDILYTSILLRSSRELSGVNIYWKNGTH